MFFTLPRLTPGYIRLLQTQAFHNVAVTPPAQKSVPGMAVLLGALGLSLCGYSSRQLALNHRPSARVLKWVGTYSDTTVAVAAHRTQQVDVPRHAGAYQEVSPPSFVAQKVSVK